MIVEICIRIISNSLILRLQPPLLFLIIFFKTSFCSIGNEFVLPPITSENIGHLSASMNFNVYQFHFVGNTVFEYNELVNITKRFTNRSINNIELEHVRQILTTYFVDHGYINTIITLPDQTIANGIIKFHIHVGGLSRILVSGNKRLQTDQIIKWIENGISPQLNINRLQQNLALLQYNPNIEKITAQLGKSNNVDNCLLDVVISEKNPLSLSMEFNNHRAPAIGAERLRLHVTHFNLTGISDTMTMEYGITKGDIEEVNLSGLDDINLTYSIPINNGDTTLSIDYNKKDSTIIEEPFRELDIESELENFRLALLHPLIKTVNRHIIISLNLEHRQNETIIKSLGLPFSIFTTGSNDSKTKLTVVRIIQEYFHQTVISHMRFRSTLNIGINALHPTKIKGSTRDGKFISWMGQYQYIRRIGNSASQLILRSNFQWTDDELLSLEQFNVGGYASVRGYRENQLVRDRGLVASLEVRLPLMFNKKGKEIVQIAPFYNFGRATNNGSSISEFNDISSIGIGLLTSPLSNLKIELYWGYPLRDVDIEHTDLQDYGIHFNIQFGLFNN